MKSTIKISSDGKSLLKTCRSKTELENELRVYKLELNFTPKLIAIHDNLTLEIEYIRGKTLSPDIYLDTDTLGSMFSTLHMVTLIEEKALCHLDTNPKNYIVGENGYYYMIDFSESGYSYVEHDLVNCLLFWAACYEPNRFEEFFYCFLKAYRNRELWKSQRNSLFSLWFKAFDDRRKKYGKQPCLNKEWQDRNRQLILHNFYRYSK